MDWRFDKWGRASAALALAVILAIPVASAGNSAAPTAVRARVEAAIANAIALVRPNQDGVATAWDANKFVQCRNMVDGVLRCEAAGALMQPTLASQLTPERVAALGAAGWQLDPSFGNYVQRFSNKLSAAELADKLLEALATGYAADLTKIEVSTTWIARVACPPRAGFSQNLAGSINASQDMAAVSVVGCKFTAGDPDATPLATLDALLARDLARVTGEVGRLRVNAAARVFAVFGTGIGYVQCAPEIDPLDIYCEAQSAAEWPALTAILTPERITQLHALGFSDPGRAPNYWQVYDAAEFDDATIARNILTGLFDIYGYRGTPAIKVTTEQ